MKKCELIRLLTIRATGNRKIAENLEESLPDSAAYFSGNANAYEEVIELLKECE